MKCVKVRIKEVRALHKRNMDRKVAFGRIFCYCPSPSDNSLQDLEEKDFFWVLLKGIAQNVPLYAT